jgi:SAM-dependent methyltransferase
VAAQHGLYGSSRVAAGYAYSRPPVHPHIIRAIRQHLQRDRKAGRALDIGCGAGLSTAALDSLAQVVVGMDPEPTMLAHRRDVAPRATFVVGTAEWLPFAAGTIDLVTAAGSLNYADLNLCLPDIARVLVPEGHLAVYDFSAGRRLRDSDRLDEWYAAFERRYPPAPDYDLDVRAVAWDRFGLRLDACEDMEVALPMTLESYLSYVMSESGVETAISWGVSEAEINQWCRRTLAPVLDSDALEVLFDAYVAYVVRGPNIPQSGIESRPSWRHV